LVILYLQFLIQVKLDIVSEKYGLIDIDKQGLPKGIDPIEFDSVEELEAFLANVQRELEASRIENARLKKAHEHNFLLPLPNDEASILQLYTATKSKPTAIVGFGYFNIRVEYTYRINYYDGTPIYRFVSCESVMGYLTGASPGVEYEERNTSYGITDSYRTLIATSEGLLHYYLLIDGFLKIYSEWFVQTTSFTAAHNNLN